jgi:hypothetical protein
MGGGLKKWGYPPQSWKLFNISHSSSAKSENLSRPHMPFGAIGRVSGPPHWPELPRSHLIAPWWRRRGARRGNILANGEGKRDGLMGDASGE